MVPVVEDQRNQSVADFVGKEGFEGGHDKSDSSKSEAGQRCGESRRDTGRGCADQRRERSGTVH